MLPFSDRILLRLLDDAFLPPLLAAIGLETLFELSYELPSASLEEVSLGAVVRRRLAEPVLETLRTRGSESQIGGEARRVLIDHERPRQGRLEWIDALFELRLDTLVHDQGSPVETIEQSDFFIELGSPGSFAELVAALEARYGEDLANELLERLRIVDLETFRARLPQFLEIVGAEVPPFDPEAPGASRRYPLLLAMRFADALEPLENLRRARLARELLERDGNYRDSFDGAEVLRPYAVVTLFDQDAAENNQLPGQNADDVRNLVRQLFAAEDMIAHFIENV